VNALSPSGPFEEVKVAAETAYARHSLPAIFRMTPLATPDADEVLAAAGYSLFDPSFVMVAPLSDMTGVLPAQIEDAPSDEWLDGFAAANGIANVWRPAHDAIVNLIAQPAAFLTLRDGKVPVGFGLAVYERGMVGLFDIVVVPQARGQGLGRELTKTLMAWGRNAGAKRAYLNVRRVNDIALSLYASLGFKSVYTYHYRMPPI
jgi:N-acetylglutamate synthase